MRFLLGQPRAVAALESQLATRRVHHAQLFHGPPGVGKFTCAVAFAKIILCHARTEDGQACGNCASCALFAPPRQPAPTAKKPAARAAAQADDVDSDDLDPAADGDPGAHPIALAHPDLHIVVKELALFSDDAATRKRKLTQIPVEVVREHLLAPAHHSPALGHGKVLIVDEAELLNAAGQNAILKTLEEPPPGTVFILVSAREDRLLPTIRSRCQRVVFGPLDEPQVEQMLTERHPTLDPKKAKWLAIFSQGSPGRALLGLDYGLDEWGRGILGPLHEVAQGRPQPGLGAALAARIEALAGEWVNRHRNASKEAANKLAADLAFSLTAQWAARRLRETAAGAAGLEPTATEARMAPFLGAIAAVREAEARLAQNGNLPMVCDGLASAVHAAFGI